MDLTPPGETKIPFLFQFVGGAKLSVCWLLDGKIDNRFLDVLFNLP